MGDQINDRAAVLVVDNGCILLIHRRKKGRDYYVVPGGSMEPGETPEEAGVRELKEETGLTVKLAGKLCSFDNEEHTEHSFLATDPYGELRVGGPEREQQSPENQYGLEWIGADRLRIINLQPIQLRRICESLLADPTRQTGAP